MSFLEMLPSLLVAFFVCCLICYRQIKVDYFSVFLLIFLVLYILLPLFLINEPYFLVDQGANWGERFLDLSDIHHNGLIVSIGFLALFLLFYLFLHVVLPGSRVPSQIVHDGVESNLKSWGIGFTVFGFVSLLIYSSTNGGLINTLINAQSLRSGTLQEEGSLTFFKHFMRVSYLGTFCFFSLIAKSHRKTNFLPMFIISLSVSLIVVWVYAGRANAISFILVFFLFNVFFKGMNLKGVVKLLLAGIVGVLILASFRLIIRYVKNPNLGLDVFSGIESIANKIIVALSVSYSSLVVTLNEIDMESIYYGKGLFFAFLNLIPKRLFDLESPETINFFHTSLFGYVRDERGYTITASMLSYFLIEAHYFGLIIGALFIAMIIRFLQSFSYQVPRNSFFGLVTSYYLIKIPAYIVNSDPASILVSEFSILVCILLIVFRYTLLRTLLRR